MPSLLLFFHNLFMPRKKKTPAKSSVTAVVQVASVPIPTSISEADLELLQLTVQAFQEAKTNLDLSEKAYNCVLNEHKEYMEVFVKAHGAYDNMVSILKKRYVIEDGNATIDVVTGAIELVLPPQETESMPEQASAA